jgi:hypothetical protein
MQLTKRNLPEMVNYNDSYNNGNPNLFNPTGAGSWTLGAGQDWFTGASDDILNYYGGLAESAIGNIIDFSGNNNTITRIYS